MPTASALRFTAYYAAFYLTFGAFLPYFPIWLEGRGMSAEWIGLIVAAGLAGRTIISPLGARWADRSPRRRDPILLFAWACFIAFALHLPVSGPWIYLVLSFAMGALLLGQIPLIDAFAMHSSREEGFSFGPVRAVGSILFIVSNFAAGALMDARGSESVLVFILFGSGLVGAAAMLLPPGKRQVMPAEHGAELVRLGRLVVGPFGLALAASALIQGAHGFYYAFSAVAWSARGLSEMTIGALWATGVAVEVAFLWVSGRGMLGRISPATLLVIGAGASILRWGLTALAPPLPVLFLLQTLHAGTFAMSYIGFLRYAIDNVPERYAATAQAMNSALSGGVVMAIMSAASGYFYARIGIAGFAVMIIPSVLGLFAAIALSRVSALPTRGELD